MPESLENAIAVRDRIIYDAAVMLWSLILKTYGNSEGPALLERHGHPVVGDWVFEGFMAQVDRFGIPPNKCFGELLELREPKNAMREYLIKHLDGSSTWWSNADIHVLFPRESEEAKRINLLLNNPPLGVTGAKS